MFQKATLGLLLILLSIQSSTLSLAAEEVRIMGTLLATILKATPEGGAIAAKLLGIRPGSVIGDAEIAAIERFCEEGIGKRIYDELQIRNRALVRDILERPELRSVELTPEVLRTATRRYFAIRPTHSSEVLEFADGTAFRIRGMAVARAAFMARGAPLFEEITIQSLRRVLFSATETGQPVRQRLIRIILEDSALRAMLARPQAELLVDRLIWAPASQSTRQVLSDFLARPVVTQTLGQIDEIRGLTQATTPYLRARLTPLLTHDPAIAGALAENHVRTLAGNLLGLLRFEKGGAALGARVRETVAEYLAGLRY